jgi:putative tributyrin esterase
MPLIHCNFFSQSLVLSSSIDVIVPLPRKDGPQAKHPVLYLLHGYSDDHTIWQRRTSIERYVEDTNLVVVMPAVHRSFYTDMASGFKYWTYVSEELPYVVRSLFHVSEAREDTFVAGLSMGGYGAFKLALTYPERYSYAASLSGALDMANRLKAKEQPAEHKKEMEGIFGNLDQFKHSSHDVMHLARKAAQSKKALPRLYQYCGTEDFLYASNVKFHEQAEKLGLDLVYEEGPGDHKWQYWDEKIQVFLKMLPIKKINE